MEETELNTNFPKSDLNFRYGEFKKRVGKYITTPVIKR